MQLGDRGLREGGQTPGGPWGRGGGQDLEDEEEEKEGRVHPVNPLTLDWPFTGPASCLSCGSHRTLELFWPNWPVGCWN